MKKKLFTAIILSFIFCIMLSIGVSASEYDNFTKERDYYELLDQQKKEGTADSSIYLSAGYKSNTWYFNNVKTAYELGIIDLEEYDFFNITSKKLLLKDVIASYSKIASKYLENSFPKNDLDYAKEIGLITEKEYNILGPFYLLEQIKATEVGPDSLQFDYYATRKDIQVLTTRLFKIISPGKQINNFTKLVDVDSTKTPNVSVDGVLELYNLGILAGNSYGMFTPYQHITLPEFATVVTRICIPSKRQNIDESTYEKFYSQTTTVNSYKTISSADATNYITENKVDNAFSKEYAANDIVTYEDVLASFWKITTCDQKPVEAENIIKYYYYGFPITKFITVEDCSKPATKAKSAIIAMLFLNGTKEVTVTATQTIKPEFMCYFYNHELPLVNMALSVGLLENTYEDMSNTYLTKADLDKMLTLYGRKFNTIYEYNVNKLGNDIAKLVTSPSELPANADVYPYILDFAPKEVYEAMPKEFSQSPLYLHTHLYYLYPATVSYWESALNEVLNIDYTNEAAENLRTCDLRNISMMYGQSSIDSYNKLLDRYKQYVIDNEIILRGTANVLLPMVYREKDQFIYKVRVKLDFEVVHSKTNKNLLLYDKDVTYNGNKFTVYVDLPASGDAYRQMAFKFMSFNCFMNDIVYGGENIVVKK